MAPEFQIKTWLNTQEDLSLSALKGKVVVAFAFQMLCPGCIEYCLPQAKRVYSTFSPNEVAVLGLHTVFEHHDVMTENALKAFVHEYRLPFPIGIDTPSDTPGDPLPKTMRAYQMGGTPTLLLFDREGKLRKHKMGHEEDLVLGAEIMSLIRQDAPTLQATIEPTQKTEEMCTPEGCPV